MIGRPQRLLAVLASVVLAAVADHVLVRWLKLGGRNAVAAARLGSATGLPPVFVAGSSLLFYGLDWEGIAQSWNRAVATFGVASGSPVELEQLQARCEQATLTVVGVSLFDFNEYCVSDYRAELVPIEQTLRDLWQTRTEWPCCKRVLSQYPLFFSRKAFPTAGRSLAVMVGVRQKLRDWRNMGATSATVADGPSFEQKAIATAAARITDWDRARLLRNVAVLRDAIRGCHTFNGPKRLALERMLKKAVAHGHAVVVVLPVSAYYRGAFLDANTEVQFESTLAGVRHAVPGVVWVRLDDLPALQSDSNYWDLVHLNVAGRAVATDFFLERLKGELSAL